MTTLAESGDMSDDLNVAEKFKRGCIAILVGSVALACAIDVLGAVWPTIAVVLGVAAMVAIVVAGIVIYRKIRAGW